MNTIEKLQAHVYISGRVQGVNFRWSTQQTARSLGVTGWVRNLSDGRVEAVFEGDSAAVNKAIAWCYDGPPAAQVDNLEVDYSAYQGTFTDFQIN